MDQEQKQLTDTALLRMIQSIISFSTTEEMHNLSKFNNLVYRKRLAEKFNEFSISYPGLFSTIIENPKNFDMDRLHHMLNMRKQINNNSKSRLIIWLGYGI